MKKTLTVLMMILMAAVLFVSCDNNVKEPEKEPEVVKYNVAFDLSGGEGYIPEQNVVKDGKIAAVKNPTKEGYAFCGWVNSSDNKTFDLTKDTVSSNIILKAVWKLAYKVTFETGEGASEVEEQIVIVGEKATKPEDPTKTGYTFKGWLNSGSAYNFDNPVNENITLKADWTINSYTVTIDNDGGTPASYSRTVEYNSVISDVPADPTKTGFKFNGWYDGETKVDLKTLKITKGINLKAKWTAVKDSYTVNFNINGGTGTIADQTVKAGEKITGISNPKKEGFYFSGWVKSDESAFNVATDTVDTDLTLKAVWKESLTVGDTGPAGGFIFYVNPNYVEGSEDATKNWKYLEAAPSDATLNSWNGGGYYTWGTMGSSYSTATGIGTGKSNTENLLNAKKSDSSLSFPAAEACVSYSEGGYTDWFLPSKDELHQISISFSSKFGQYLSYWSSSEYGNDGANYEVLQNGHQWYMNRDSSCKVRPVRSFK